MGTIIVGEIGDHSGFGFWPTITLGSITESAVWICVIFGIDIGCPLVPYSLRQLAAIHFSFLISHSLVLCAY